MILTENLRRGTNHSLKKTEKEVKILDSGLAKAAIMSQCSKGGRVLGWDHSYHVIAIPLSNRASTWEQGPSWPQIPTQSRWRELHTNEQDHIMKRKDTYEPLRQSAIMAKSAHDKWGQFSVFSNGFQMSKLLPCSEDFLSLCWVLLPVRRGGILRKASRTQLCYALAGWPWLWQVSYLSFFYSSIKWGSPCVHWRPVKRMEGISTSYVWVCGNFLSRLLWRKHPIANDPNSLLLKM